MSIIIAKKVLNTILFFSDTKVSISDNDDSVSGGGKLQLNPLSGILKTYIISPKVCISFAGLVDNCLEIIKKAKSEEVEQLSKFLKEHLNILEDHTSEFIVGLMKESENELTKINSKEISIGNDFWTGDQKAFTEYQRHYHNSKNQHENKFTQCQWAFLDLIDNTSLPSIGDFIIETVYDFDYKSFMYCERGIFSKGLEVTHVPANTPTQIDVKGSAQQGSFHISNFISKDISKPAVALYFQQTKSGLLFMLDYCLSNNGRGKIIKANSNEEFQKQIQDQFKLELRGFLI